MNTEKQKIQCGEWYNADCYVSLCAGQTITHADE